MLNPDRPFGPKPMDPAGWTCPCRRSGLAFVPRKIGQWNRHLRLLSWGLAGFPFAFRCGMWRRQQAALQPRHSCRQLQHLGDRLRQRGGTAARRKHFVDGSVARFTTDLNKRGGSDGWLYPLSSRGTGYPHFAGGSRDHVWIAVIRLRAKESVLEYIKKAGGEIVIKKSADNYRNANAKVSHKGPFAPRAVIALGGVYCSQETTHGSGL